MKNNAHRISAFFRKMQKLICVELEKADGKAKFSTDIWKRKEGGGGVTRVIQNGNVFEKGGVNFSAVHGKCPDFIFKEYSKKNFQPDKFFATGLSIVIHPKNPMVPIIHMNVRYFELFPKILNLPAGQAGTKSKPDSYRVSPHKPDGYRVTESVTRYLSGLRTNPKWFGGGIDLTPVYINKEDAIFFHALLKKVCDKHDINFYPEFKKRADNYFFIKHRNETRGIGGIFFDKLSENKKHSVKDFFEFVKSVAETFIPAYLPIVEKNKKRLFGEKEKNWQLLRRGRYVEFNLVYDKGTKFGLETGGRTESILMSLPAEAKWLYNFTPEKNSPEEKTQSLLKREIKWIE